MIPDTVLCEGFKMLLQTIMFLFNLHNYDWVVSKISCYMADPEFLQGVGGGRGGGLSDCPERRPAPVMLR